ncbi:hypothetical protein FACS189459_3010 [Bacilli bacterium]|nr:hypothetical protein FACS189459_3010 [Bacilli bacterium]GHU51692.1 hypothetical protein FACS189496_0420 [Bacilli bacterium]
MDDCNVPYDLNTLKSRISDYIDKDRQIRLIIIDYASLITDCSTRFKKLATELTYIANLSNIAIIIVNQVNADGTARGGQDMMYMSHYVFRLCRTNEIIPMQVNGLTFPTKSPNKFLLKIKENERLLLCEKKGKNSKLDYSAMHRYLSFDIPSDKYTLKDGVSYSAEEIQAFLAHELSHALVAIKNGIKISSLEIVRTKSIKVEAKPFLGCVHNEDVVNDSFAMDKVLIAGIIGEFIVTNKFDLSGATSDLSKIQTIKNKKFINEVWLLLSSYKKSLKDLCHLLYMQDINTIEKEDLMKYLLSLEQVTIKNSKEVLKFSALQIDTLLDKIIGKNSNNSADDAREEDDLESETNNQLPH